MTTYISQYIKIFTFNHNLFIHSAYANRLNKNIRYLLELLLSEQLLDSCSKILHLKHLSMSLNLHISDLRSFSPQL